MVQVDVGDSIREWIEDFKLRLLLFASSPQRKKFLRFLLSLDEDCFFYPDWIAEQIGVARSTVRWYLRIVRSLFNENTSPLDGVSIVKVRVEKRKVLYGNNLKEYVRSCLKFFISEVDDELLDYVVKEVLSFVSSLSTYG